MSTKLLITIILVISKNYIIHCFDEDELPNRIGWVLSPYTEPKSRQSTIDMIGHHPSVRLCDPISVFVLTRHGASSIPIDANKFELLKHDISNFGRYAPGDLNSFLEESDKYKPEYLHPRGRQDMKRLGKRIFQYWPNLGLKSNKLVDVKMTNSPRTMESAFWLVYGLKKSLAREFQAAEKGGYHYIFSIARALKTTLGDFHTALARSLDAVLQPHNYCERVERRRNDRKRFGQMKTFRSRSDYRALKNHVTSKFSEQQNSQNLEKKYQALYTACLGNSMLRISYILCHPFPEQLALAEEFRNDLNMYDNWVRSEELYNHTCLLATALEDSMNKTIESHLRNLERGTAGDEHPSNDVPSHVIRVTEWETLLPFIASLRLFDLPAIDENTDFLKERLFHSGDWTPMGANLILTIYACPPRATGNWNGPTVFKVMVLLNEQLLMVEEWDHFKTRFNLCSMAEFEKWCR